VPVRRDDHAQAIANLALEMNAYIKQYPGRSGHPVAFRLGISSGPLVAGVIGCTKYHYDIWGDTVNTASRMESHGVPGKIQIAQSTYELIKDEFDCTRRGVVQIKGKGPMQTWFLEGSRQYSVSSVQ